MSKELEVKVNCFTIKKPKYQKLYIQDEDCVDTIVINEKEYKCSDIVKHEKAFEIIKECFDLNGFDELVPNSKWFESEEKQDLLRKVLL